MLYERDNYRDVIKSFCRLHHKTLRFLAERSRIHNSYFSRVMVGKTEFSATQLFAIGEAMDLD